MQPDFQEQKGLLSETLSDLGHIAEFYPKFHCELNWIEFYWGAAKRYAREHCEYSIHSLRYTIPAALASVPNSTIHAFYHQALRRIQAYRAGISFGTPEFAEYLKRYKSHRRIYFMGSDT